MLAQTSQTAPPPSAEMSDGGSSSLSELDDIPEEQQEYDTIEKASDDEDVRDNDTEASTERIDPSPQKPLRAPMHELSALDILGDAAAVEQLQEADAANDRQEYDLATLRIAEQHLDSPAIHSPERLSAPESPRKRKRSSSLSDLEDQIEESAPPARKRSTSTRAGSAAVVAERQYGSFVEDVAEGEEARPEIEPMSDMESGPDAPSPRVTQEAAVTITDDLQADDEGALSDITPPPDEPSPPPEEPDQDQPAEPAPDDDPTTRDQDEQQRKNAALVDLKPIENLFAILRDKLFDERLTSLSTEIASLQQPAYLVTHPDFINKRACIDARRDAKIAHAETEFRYKSGALERKALAERAIEHGQYIQEVRALRETHLEKMNAHFSALSRERKAYKAKDPHYLYRFDNKRANQIRNQQSYNKEVSILAGLARYKGFPAAPALGPAPPTDVDDDLRRIRSAVRQAGAERSNTQAGFAAGHHLAMTPIAALSTPNALLNGTPLAHARPLPNGIDSQRAQPMSVAAQIASEEMAGEATFLERNPWARQIPLATLGRAPASMWDGDAGSKHSPIEVDGEGAEENGDGDVDADDDVGMENHDTGRREEQPKRRVNGFPHDQDATVNGLGVRYGPIERPTQSPEIVKKEAERNRSPFAGPSFAREGFVRSVGVSS